MRKSLKGKAVKMKSIVRSRQQLVPDRERFGDHGGEACVDFSPGTIPNDAPTGEQVNRPTHITMRPLQQKSRRIRGRFSEV
jgi:hypothetical protein